VQANKNLSFIFLLFRIVTIISVSHNYYNSYLTVGYCSPQIRPVFEKHGNVVEVVILKDKRTGQQQGIEMQIFFLSIL
jgi:hypothetical protein